jgi:hypothetical protein
VAVVVVVMNNTKPKHLEKKNPSYKIPKLTTGKTCG